MNNKIIYTIQHTRLKHHVNGNVGALPYLHAMLTKKQANKQAAFIRNKK